MSDHVYKSVEITGSSETGVQEAIDGALAKAGQTLRNIDWFEVINIRGGLDRGGDGQHRRAAALGGAGGRDRAVAVAVRFDDRAQRRKRGQAGAVAGDRARVDPRLRSQRH